MSTPGVVNPRLLRADGASGLVLNTLGYTCHEVRQFVVEGHRCCRRCGGTELFEVAEDGAFGAGIAQLYAHRINAGTNAAGDQCFARIPHQGLVNATACHDRSPTIS
ncbi:hypothetical protein D3C76_1308970 [compost metagenome]